MQVVYLFFIKVFGFLVHKYLSAAYMVQFCKFGNTSTFENAPGCFLRTIWMLVLKIHSIIWSYISGFLVCRLLWCSFTYWNIDTALFFSNAMSYNHNFNWCRLYQYANRRLIWIWESSGWHLTISQLNSHQGVNMISALT